MIKKQLAIILFLLASAFPLHSDPQLTYEILERFEIPDTHKMGVRIRLISTGFSKGFPLFLSQHTFAGMIDEFPQQLFVDYDGKLAGSGAPANIRENILLFPDGTLTILGYMKGQPVTLSLYSKENKETASVEVVPFPNEVKDAKGRSLSVVFISSELDQVRLEGKGFSPGEELEFCSRSCHEVETDAMKVPPDGKFMILIQPGVIGYDRGDAVASVKGKNGLFLKLNYVWGFSVYPKA